MQLLVNFTWKLDRAEFDDNSIVRNNKRKHL